MKLFSQKSGWNHCWCVHFHRSRALPKDEWVHTRHQRGVRNRREQKVLVDQGRSHGILVYAKEEALGWCQYGSREELTRTGNSSNDRGLGAKNQTTKLWRITCFVVDRKYRRRGLAGAALRAALASIKKKGGGSVEVFPAAIWEGKAFGNMSTGGTISMFKREGFKIVAPFGKTNVLMRRII